MDGVVYTYYYVGDKLVRETYGDTVMDFFYDQNGQPYAMKYNDTMLYYILNQQGDVVRLVTNGGTSYGVYRYDAWGNILYSTDNKWLNDNPLRYRGYVYDTETALYYCQSRYYDPNMGRFINADALVSTGQGILGNNMFAYCNNNPVNLADGGGTSASLTINPNANNYDVARTGGGGEGILIVLGEAVTGVVEGVIRIATWTFAATTYSSAYTSAYAQNTSVLRLAEQTPPDDQYQYWEAYLFEKKVCTGKGLSIWEAALRVACGQNVMCANQDAALWIVKINRYHNAIGPEVGRGEAFFYHYHPHRNTKVHIWFYGGVDS